MMGFWVVFFGKWTSTFYEWEEGNMLTFGWLQGQPVVEAASLFSCPSIVIELKPGTWLTSWTIFPRLPHNYNMTKFSTVPCEQKWWMPLPHLELQTWHSLPLTCQLEPICGSNPALTIQMITDDPKRWQKNNLEGTLISKWLQGEKLPSESGLFTMILLPKRKNTLLCLQVT